MLLSPTIEETSGDNTSAVVCLGLKSALDFWAGESLNRVPYRQRWPGPVLIGASMRKDMPDVDIADL
jgi:hypothetical protein